MVPTAHTLWRWHVLRFDTISALILTSLTRLLTRATPAQSAPPPRTLPSLLKCTLKLPPLRPPPPPPLLTQQPQEEGLEEIRGEEVGVVVSPVWECRWWARVLCRCGCRRAHCPG